MNTTKLMQFLSDIHPLSEDFAFALKKELIQITFPKHHHLLEAPKISDHAFFLNKGFAMAYSFNDGNKITENFWKPGQVVMSTLSFFEQIPSFESIQLMEKSEVLCISYAGVQRLFVSYPEALHLFRIIMNRHYEYSRNRVHDMKQLNAAKRFEKLLVVFPGIEQIIPQDCIATYLGITPQSLSRLKRHEGNS
jgi:CRP-like cAMP-binding protein